MSGANGVSCTRCGRDDAPRITVPTFPGETGQRIAAEICADCWEAWKKHQMALINHYALNVRDAEARNFLSRSMEGFLFGGDDDAGTGADAPAGAGPSPEPGPSPGPEPGGTD